MATPTPSLAGSLRTRPVAPLLVAILDGRRTGTLVVEEPNGTKSAVYFSEGAPAKAKTAEALIHVGSLLVEKGAIDQATHDATLRRVARERQLHGQILLDEGAVDEPTLHSGLKEQILRRVAWLFGRPAGALAGFYDGVNFLERWGGPELLRVSPLAAIWRGIRDHENPEAVRAVLASLGDTPLTLHEDADLAGFELAGAECDVCTALAAAQPLRLGELLGMNVAEPDLVNRLVHAFVVTRHLDLGTGRPPGSGSGQGQADHPQQAATYQGHFRSGLRIYFRIAE